MQVTVEDISSVKKKIHVEIPQEDVARELDAAYSKLKKNAKIKGYRPGKTPRSVLERVFKKDVHSEVAGTLIQNTFIDALKEQDLNILGSPEIDPAELTPDAPFSYNATVELKPELATIDFEGVKLQKKKYGASSEEVENQLKMIRHQLAEYKVVEESRPAAQDDFVVIDYEGFKDGQPFEPTQKTENHTVKIGQGSMTEDFDQQLVGMKPGETREFNIRFADDYHNSELAGQEITFSVTLKEIREQILPALDDEFAKKLGDYQSIDQVREQVMKNLQEGYEKRTSQELQEQIFNKLMTQDVELPEQLVQFELDGIIADAQMRFSQNNISMEELGLTREAMSEQYRDLAEKQVRRHLFLGKIIEQEKMTVTDEELEAEYSTFARSLGQPIDIIKQFYNAHPDKLDGFKHALLEKKAIDLIIEKADVEEVEPGTEPAGSSPEPTE